MQGLMKPAFGGVETGEKQRKDKTSVPGLALVSQCSRSQKKGRKQALSQYTQKTR